MTNSFILKKNTAIRLIIPGAAMRYSYRILIKFYKNIVNIENYWCRKLRCKIYNIAQICQYVLWKLYCVEHVCRVSSRKLRNREASLRSSLEFRIYLIGRSPLRCVESYWVHTELIVVRSKVIRQFNWQLTIYLLDRILEILPYSAQLLKAWEGSLRTKFAI